MQQLWLEVVRLEVGLLGRRREAALDAPLAAWASECRRGTAPFGGPWPAIALSRSMGAPVHPLACGLVMVGWWEWRSDRRPATLLRGYLSGVGIHALWNGSLVVIGVVESVLSLGGSVAGALGPLALTYAPALGVALCGVLGLAVVGIAEDRPAIRAPGLRDGRMLAGWTVISATLLVPVAVLVLAFPAFYRG